ncbi:hypothetical protein CC80DRAFT_405337 [Byssothecium circinans]|uniref:FAD-binding FR-type domain-containing protein n=1 Tax=Byssothecium circinans TaxID=147558 RepID=A0A6A5U5D9_9PLEO|nr:hypothetical protein CC80DRAFT_405337 [Byssothecium circinans]
MWAVFGGILLIFILSRLFRSRRRNEEGAKQSFLYRSQRSISAAIRRYTLAESLPRLFPNTSRLQILVLATLCVYLTIFSLIGIVYKTWITPIKNSDKFNTRTGLGGFSDRIGALAYALTPLTVALSMRDSILSLLTGIPYLHFNFLHRWTGRIILAQSMLHTIGWTIIEGKLYQPQPKVYNTWIRQTYMIWGIVAQGFICFLFVFSLRPVIKLTGYEFFKKSHLIVAGLYLGACWGHWDKLACWMIASLGLLGIDLGMRLLRMFLIHMGYKDGNKGLGFRAIQSKAEVFKDPSGTVVRLSFVHNHEPWKIGQHFYLTFPALSIWQSHPFTPASTPPTAFEPPMHTYIIRSRSGETGNLAALSESASVDRSSTFETPVILVGPYGRSIVDHEASNILAIAGGTGITFALPVIAAALNDPYHAAQNIEMIWIIRHIENLAWLGPEIAALRRHLDSTPSPSSTSSSSSAEDFDINADTAKSPAEKITIRPTTPPAAGKSFRIRIFITRAPETRTHVHLPSTFPSSSSAAAATEKDFATSSSSASSSASTTSAPTHSREVRALIAPHPNFSITYLDHSRPQVENMVDAFLTETVVRGRTQVVGSGPAALGTEIRRVVAGRNSAAGVWRGDEGGDVACFWDDRLG